MADLRKEIRAELDVLISEGELLHVDELVAKSGGELLEAMKAELAKAEEDEATKDTKEIPSKEAKKEYEERSKKPFSRRYQSWYSRALSTIEHLMPDRYDEFRELYRLDKQPKELNLSTYTISDYIAGITVTRGLAQIPAFDQASVALTNLQNQVEILSSARERLDSRLADIQGVLEAGLFDDELNAARDLVKAKYLRSAGVIAGVVLERHLKRLIDTHEITFRKKAQIGNLNDALKGAGVYGVPQWRKIQRLGDLRNKCGHDGEDPEKEEVEELLDGVEKTVSTVF